MEGVEELGDRVVLGQVQGGDAEPAPAQGDLLDAEGLAGARRSEDGDGDWLGGVLPCVPVVICIDVLVQQGLDGVVVLDLPQVYRRQNPVAADGDMAEQVVRPLQHDVLGHCQIAPGLRFAELVQDAEGVGTGDQGLQAPVGHRHPADLTVLPALSQAAQDLIEVGGVTQGPLLAAVGGEEQGPVPVLPDEGALLVEEDHHVLPAAQGPQGIIYRQLEEEFIHGTLVGDLPADGEVQLAQVLHAEQGRLGGGEGLGQQQAGLIGLIVGSGFHGGLLSERAGPGPGGRCLFSIVDAFSGLGKSWGWEMKREKCHTKNNNCHTKERNP